MSQSPRGWRNCALTIQVVAVASDGSNDYSLGPSLSAGGVQGAATAGLLWELTIFEHWSGSCCGDSDWF
jgi:hypothetical protein